MTNINIAYVLNEDNYYMTIVSMQSVIESNKQNIIDFYIVKDKNFDCDLSVIKNFKKYSNCNNIVISVINLARYISLNIYFHDIFCVLDFADIVPFDRALFLSNFSFVQKDLSELYNIDLSNFSCGVIENIYSPKDNNIKSKHLFEVMLINLDYFRKQQYYDKLVKRLSYLAETLNHTQALNLILDNVKTIDMSWNYQEMYSLKPNHPVNSIESQKQYHNYLTHIETPSIVTLVGPKPLLHDCKNSYVGEWWKYAERTPIYKEIKGYRQLNKYKLTNTSAQNSFKYGWLLSRIWPYIKPYWFRILIGFLIAIPLGLLDGVTAFALKPYMDYVIGGKAFEFSWHGLNLSITSLQMAWILPIGVIAFAGLQGVLRYLNGYVSTWTSQRITNDVKFDLFKRLIHMHPQFFDDNSSGVVISRYMGDPGTASAGIVDNVKTITTSLCGALGLIAVMIYSSWQLAFIGVLVLCVAFIPVILIRNRIKEASNKNMVIGSNITTNINETYSGNKVMTAYGLQDRQNEYFVKQTWKSFNINMSLYKRAGWMSPMMYLIASCGIATVLGVGTYLINSGQMTAGSFASFVTSLLLLYKPVKTLGNTLTGIQNIFVAMGRVFELFDLNPELKDKESAKELNDLTQAIEFNNVTFGYNSEHQVLKHLNLKINKGETLAIVGNSGGGKSTLVNLLPRFYDVTEGSITIDGIDLRDYKMDSIRKNISMVFQDNFLFSGTIKENILMGNPKATNEELEAAIEAAHLDEMIADLPDGINTYLGERGLSLSGGQRQRVAIARAMIKNSPIVILDEATSALDNKSEAIVQKALDNLIKNKTVFVIAHRLSTIKNANRIAVINEGELVELGSHEELMNIENGQYKALYDMQFKKQETAVV